MNAWILSESHVKMAWQSACNPRDWGLLASQSSLTGVFQAIERHVSKEVDDTPEEDI